MSSAALACLALFAPASFANAQTTGNVAITAQAGSQRLVLPKGKSAIIDLPVEARDVVVADPKVADAVMRTSKRGFILGNDLGETNVYFLDAQGRQILTLEVRVARDTSELDALVQKLVPDARVTFDGVGDSIIISGNVPNAGIADKVYQISKQYAGGDEKKVVNMMNIMASDQVMLQVRIIEMQRSVLKQLGINLAATNLFNKLLPDDWGLNFATTNGFSANGSFLGGTSLGATWAKNLVTPSSVTYNGSGVTPFDPIAGAGAGGYNYTPPSATCDITGTVCTLIPSKTTYGPGTIVQDKSANSNIQAMERVGLARTLAEPNLIATTGESSKFLAGGEFPVPTNQEGNRISVSFKPFGVGLGFTPVVISQDRITLKVSTEVSEISTTVSYRQPDSTITNADGTTSIVQGLSIPGVITRRAEATMEIPSGKSMMMAGLIQQDQRTAIEGLPGVKDLPVIGNLFRSRDFVNKETELVIIVTPYIVKPTTIDKLKTPGDGFSPASDASTLLLGRLNRIVKPSSTSAPEGTYNAPVGHVLQ